jgi:protein-L-isoaspartate O-methyltransferase
MSSSSLPQPAPAVSPPAAVHSRTLLATLTAAIFVSAALLFAVQPMFTKMVLPRLGGAPSVWSVAMVFFQAALLAGYGYAHALTRFAPGRASVVIHVAVMLAACLALPLHIATGWGKPPEVGEAFWLLGLFAVSIGLPFFALAANSPLLQAWFARTDHPAAKDPYFLYAASNIGSFLALLAYPVVIEPLVRLGDQTRAWTFGFFILIALIVACGALLWRARNAPAAAETDTAAEASPPGWGDVAAWVGLAAVPAGMLVAVTAHISTDVAAVPLLWVLPLALYLATFVIVFSRRPVIPHWLVVAVQPVFVLALVTFIVLEAPNPLYFPPANGPIGTVFNFLGTVGAWIATPFKPMVGQIAIHLTVFFVCALMCHGELARRRPAPRHLTSFYMWMSAGGMIGGIAAGLAAPYLFNWIAEYPILITLAVLCRPGLALPKQRFEQAIFFGAVVIATLAIMAFREYGIAIDDHVFTWVVAALLVVTVLFWRDPLPFAAIIAFVLLANHYIIEVNGVNSVRSFFGVAKISESYDGRFRLLSHGTTLHGGQRIRDAQGQPLTGRPELIMYYYDGSAIAQVLDAARARTGGAIRYAVIGLGTGSLTCRAEPADTVHYYEIDPAIVHIARDPNLFSFVSECRPDVPIILGDARLTLAEAPDAAYDAIIVDAFSSDAIPIHLLTREAMAIYLKKLSPGGIVSIHVSNRHLELASVVAGIAAANGAITRVNDGGDATENENDYMFIGTVTAVARRDEDFGPLAQSQFWAVQEPDPEQWVWTDDYSNIVGALIRRLRE